MITIRYYQNYDHKNIKKNKIFLIKIKHMKTILIATDFSRASRNPSLYGVQFARAINANVILFNEADNALTYLKATQVVYQLILIDICLPNAYRFVDNFYELGGDSLKGMTLIKQ